MALCCLRSAPNRDMSQWCVAFLPSPSCVLFCSTDWCVLARTCVDFNPGETQPHGCWIGLADRSDPTAGTAADDQARFQWHDGSPLNYAHWAPGEPK